ncbi:MAG: trehalose-6-phosphate synthase [Thermodesulfobacteriota bacterium]
MKTVSREKLIVVSNREPYTFKKGRAEKTVGGLVSALDPVMRASKGVWIASGSDAGRVMVPPDDPSYTMRLVPLTQRDIEGYYNGYSNRFLWPLCHITLDRIYLKKSYWQSYKKVNALFADAIVEEARKKGTRVWLQDYHLAICAAYIKEKRPDLKLSIFWHIPWPPHDVFRACPQGREILEGLLANDLIGFQLDSFCRNFMRCAAMEFGTSVEIKGRYIKYRGHITKVKSFPISVDFEWFERAALARRSGRFFERFKKERKLDGVMLGLSVDRLEYTKGIIKSLEAVEFLFAKYPRFKGKFTFVQIAVPTRKVEPYLSYMERVRKKAAALNARYSTADWRPVEYMESRFSHNDLAALYRGADFAMISSVYDGMNLVAKEYVSSQVDLKGALLVSEFAGAAEDVPGITTINPYDTESCADSIKEALEADPAKKRKAMGRARAYVSRNDIYKWVEDVLGEMKGLG